MNLVVETFIGTVLFFYLRRQRSSAVPQTFERFISAGVPGRLCPTVSAVNASANLGAEGLLRKGASRYVILSERQGDKGCLVLVTATVAS